MPLPLHHFNRLTPRWAKIYDSARAPSSDGRPRTARRLVLHLNYRRSSRRGLDGKAKGTVVGALGGGYDASEAASTGKGEASWRHPGGVVEALGLMSQEDICGIFVHKYNTSLVNWKIENYLETL